MITEAEFTEAKRFPAIITPDEFSAAFARCLGSIDAFMAALPESKRTPVNRDIVASVLAVVPASTWETRKLHDRRSDAG
jgi:hypothetical protein